MKRRLRTTLLVLAALILLWFATAITLVHVDGPAFAHPPRDVAADQAGAGIVLDQTYASTDVTFMARDGVALHGEWFEQRDSDLVVVFLHGILASSFQHNRFAGLLRETIGASVLNLDLRGHGQSGGTPGDVAHVGQYEEDLADVVGVLRHQVPGRRILLAGHSMGGGIALRYAAQPAVPPVDGWLLFAPHLGIRSPTMPREFSAGDDYVAVHVPRIIGLVMLNLAGIDSWNDLRTLYFNLPPEMSVRSYTWRAMRSMAPSDHAAALAAIGQPLLVVVGSEDESFLAPHYEAAVQPHAPQAQVVVLPGLNHNTVLLDETAMQIVREWAHSAGIAMAPAQPGR